jgi:UPF0716 protein FxsA
MFIEIGSIIGSLYVILSILITAFLGYYLIKQKLRNLGISLFSLNNMNNIYSEYASSMYSLLGGILLIIPGYITDTAGLILMLPVFRPKLSSFFESKYSKKANKTNIIEGDYRDSD